MPGAHEHRRSSASRHSPYAPTSLDAAVTALCDGAPLLEELTLWRCASLRAPRIKGAELRLVNLCENALIDDEGAGRIGGAC